LSVVLFLPGHSQNYLLISECVSCHSCTPWLQCYEFQGRSWPQQVQLASAGVRPGDFIALHQRLRGGGGDGGSTGAESRSSFLEMYATKKAAKVIEVYSSCQISCINGPIFVDRTRQLVLCTPQGDKSACSLHCSQASTVWHGVSSTPLVICCFACCRSTLWKPNWPNGHDATCLESPCTHLA
jgi:hypothetical protein